MYTAQIAASSQVAELYPKRGKNYVFQTDGSDKQHEILEQFGYAKISREATAKKRFLMAARPSMTQHLEKLSKLIPFQNGVLFYALWKGYQKNEYVKNFLDFMESKGCKIHVLHTSGHADCETIDELIAAVQPKTVVPVHTEKADYFKKFGKSCNVVLDCDEFCV